MRDSINIIFYVITVLAWGSAFFSASLQVGEVPLAWSVSYRFLLAACPFFIWTIFRARSIHFPWRYHFVFLLFGILLFSFHFLAVYESTTRIPSGLTAIGFSTIVIFNVFFSSLLLGVKLEPSVLAGAILGLCGVGFVFAGELSGIILSGPTYIGMVLAIVAALIASFGNILSVWMQRRKVPVVEASAWSMLYGGIVMALYALITGQRLTFDLSTGYWLPLIYLVIFCTCIAFWSYLSLLGRVGAGRAGYAWVVAPSVALLLSSFFESYDWPWTAFIGVLMLILGNVLIISQGPKSKSRPA